MLNPSVGTVTFLFTDVEGSTRLLQTLGDEYPELLAAHHRLMRTALRGALEEDRFRAIWGASAAAPDRVVSTALAGPTSP